jgi:hypothetical protein
MARRMGSARFVWRAPERSRLSYLGRIAHSRARPMPIQSRLHWLACGKRLKQLRKYSWMLGS